ncbi:MAG: hypothetical protein J1E01_00370 [Acetatifactor sp.]|nr:hypothetical protein [Acetatifactor sp.]
MDTHAEKIASIGDENEAANIDEIIALLDGYTQAGGSRLKIDVVEGQGEVLSRQYHHGRCDVGSPWACGTAFDVLEDEEDEQ